MWLPVLGLTAALLASLVLRRGLAAARTRKLSLFGLVPSGVALAASAAGLVLEQPEQVLRAAGGAAAIAGGIAHAVVFTLCALPARRTWLRALLVPPGILAGSLLSLWFVLPERSAALDAAVAVLLVPVLASWAVLPWLSRRRRFVTHGTRQIDCVRCACPRCGTRVDFGQLVAACTDCGLFLHVFWPADELHAEEGRPKVAQPLRHVRFDCPSCARRADWPCGDSACAACGLKVALHWNAHVRA